jgi:hypothetical protein
MTRATLTVHLDRSNEVVSSGKNFVYSFGIANEDVNVGRRHECPDWSIAKMGARFVLEVPSSTGVPCPCRQEACDRELVDYLPGV